jgi:arabinogalactan endo-1,4-beta-galactosidase
VSNNSSPAHPRAQIGNEINDGLLWPVGQISKAGYSAPSQLLNSAAAGVRAAGGSTKIAVHLANGWDSSTLQSWFNGMFIAGAFSSADVDVRPRRAPHTCG